MSEISNRAILIAVGLLVTIAITSSVVMVIGYFRDIYSSVRNTDISIRRMFTKYDPYDNTTVTGLDALNAYNKFKKDPLVTIKHGTADEPSNTVTDSNVSSVFSEDTYSKWYTATYTNEGDYIIIRFVKK